MKYAVLETNQARARISLILVTSYFTRRLQKECVTCISLINAATTTLLSLQLYTGAIWLRK